MTKTNTNRASRTRQTKSRKPKYEPVSERGGFVKIAIYGPSGSGKTTFASTFPGPALLIDIQDEGTDSVSDVKGLQVAYIETLDDLEDVYWDLYEGDHKFKTVILDTTTMLQHLKIVELVGEKLKKLGKQPGDWGTMRKQDWGEVAAYLKDQITRFRNLPMNVVFIAQERIFNVSEEDDGDEGMLDPEVGPAMSPSVKTHLNAAVNVIARTFVRSREIKKKDEKGRTKTREKIEYCLRVGPSPVFTTKIRKPKSITLPDILVDPEYDDLIAIIKGEE